MPVQDLIKHIIVHVDDMADGHERLSLAASLAQRFNCYLTGIGDPENALLEEDFGSTLEARRLGGEWLAATGSMAAFVARRAHVADLVVVGQRAPGASSLDKPEDVILTCGRPVLVVPNGNSYSHVGENVIVAWNDSREAALAIEGALPLLTEANPVTIVSVKPHPDCDWQPDSELIHQLARHGFRADAEAITEDGRSPASLVSARATSTHADLVVMGAYGHSRWREMVLGGMTHDMLADMNVPLLMAH